MDIEIVEDKTPVKVSNSDDMMMEVIKLGQVDALERMIALREREEARHAALAFDTHFAAMQAEFRVVGRNKQGFKFKYAPIEALQMEYTPTIAKHGFSYSWDEEQIEGGKRCRLTISGYGSKRQNTFDVPLLTGTDRMNEIQVAGAMSTYGRRYTFISGFGIIIADEDSDGEVSIDVDEYATFAEKLNLCESIEVLASVWSTIYPKVKDSPAAVRYLTGVKDAKKEMLL